jgi:hypothetical protein
MNDSKGAGGGCLSPSHDPVILSHNPFLKRNANL